MHANLADELSGRILGAYGEIPDKKTPFEVRIYPNLLDEETFKKLKDSVNSGVVLDAKDNDLYRFKQSKDLKTETAPGQLSSILLEFINVMSKQVKDHLAKATGLKLSSRFFDITASRYDAGDYLLCHNDDIKVADKNLSHARVLAFVYYLNSRPWTEKDGGSLTLYDIDSTEVANLPQDKLKNATLSPRKINNRIFPKPNTLIVFPTTPNSWHSVDEVFCKNDSRLSINGWFHSEQKDNCVTNTIVTTDLMNVDSEGKYSTPLYTFDKPIPLDERLENFFETCVNPDYLSVKTCMAIQKRFKRKSEINLTNFLVKEKFAEICKALKETVAKEENVYHVGPYDKRNYKRIKPEKLPPICRDLFDAFRSELFFMLLARFTGLHLQPPNVKTSNGDADGSDEGSDESSEDEDSDDSLSLEDEVSDESDDDYDDDDDDDDDDGDDEAAGNNNDEKGSNIFKPNLDKNKDGSGDAGPSILNMVKDRIETSESTSKQSSDKQPEVPRNADNNNSNVAANSKTSADKPTTSKASSDEQASNKSPLKRKKTSDPHTRIEFRHLESGSYTMIHDHGFEMQERSGLDVIFHMNHDFPVNLDDGGYTSYLDGVVDEEERHDMDYELLTIEPKSNCLSLVYRCDEGTVRFLKYLTKSHKSAYQDLNCVYYEKPDEMPKEVYMNMDKFCRKE